MSDHALLWIIAIGVCVTAFLSVYAYLMLSTINDVVQEWRRRTFGDNDEP